MPDIKVVRYSNHGFAPQYQKVMAFRIESMKEFKESDLGNNITDYSRRLIIENVEKERKLLQENFPLYGIHVFFDTAREDFITFMMNHLGTKPPRHEMMMPDDTPAYNVDSPYLQQKPKTLRQLYDEYYECAYINLVP